VLLGTSRGLLIQLQKHLQRTGVGIRRVAILGDGTDAKALADSLERRPGEGFRLVGYIGTPTESLEPHLGGRAELESILAATSGEGRERIDEVLVVDTEDPGALGQVVAQCQKARVDCRVLANVLGFPTYRLRLEDRFGVPLLSLRPWPLDHLANRVAKRVLDVVSAAFGLVVLSPVLLVIALAIKLTSAGPVLFRQARVGRGGRHFVMLKFRSMRGDAEGDTGPVWTTEDDPRRTWVGTLLRRWSLDELPQLINVLKGEMSLVGPRPERPPFVEEFAQKYPRYDERHRIRPGMTGWAQVHGLRGNTSVRERTRYDLYYLEKWSLWLDIKILVRTALGVFHHQHAY
jgi:exopolysaccharide biosynthesis polyprenyl glycosylphosphotransferase